MTIQFVPQIIMAGTEITPANAHFFMQEGDAHQGTPLEEALHNVAIQFDAASHRAARSHDAAVERARDLVDPHPVLGAWFFNAPTHTEFHVPAQRWED